VIDDLLAIYRKRHQWKKAIRQFIHPREKVYYGMHKSLVKCQKWEDHLNSLAKNAHYPQAKIYVENWVDEAAKPKNFQVANFMKHYSFRIK
jgi:hypothetical protein